MQLLNNRLMDTVALSYYSGPSILKTFYFKTTLII